MLVVGPPSVYHLAMAELNPACLFVRESRNFWSLANSNWTSMNVASVSTSKICPTSRLNGHHPPLMPLNHLWRRREKGSYPHLGAGKDYVSVAASGDPASWLARRDSYRGNDVCCGLNSQRPSRYVICLPPRSMSILLTSKSGSGSAGLTGSK